jgi:hypothetical protein
MDRALYCEQSRERKVGLCMYHAHMACSAWNFMETATCSAFVSYWPAIGKKHDVPAFVYHSMRCVHECMCVYACVCVCVCVYGVCVCAHVRVRADCCEQNKWNRGQRVSACLANPQGT